MNIDESLHVPLHASLATYRIKHRDESVQPKNRKCLKFSGNKRLNKWIKILNATTACLPNLPNFIIIIVEWKLWSVIHHSSAVITLSTQQEVCVQKREIWKLPAILDDVVTKRQSKSWNLLVLYIKKVSVFFSGWVWYMNSNFQVVCLRGALNEMEICIWVKLNGKRKQEANNLPLMYLYRVPK